MKKLNLAQIFSLFIALIMVSSIASYMFFGTTQTKQNQANQQKQNLPKVQPKIETYNAEVDANVVELFPSLFLVAKTQEAEKSILDNTIINVGSIAKFNSYYVAESQQPKIMKSLTYAANIVLAEDENITEFAKKLKDLNVFESVEIYRISLARLPKEITYTKENDANITRKHTLEEPFTNVYVDLHTIKGDLIKVSLKAFFADGQLFRQIGFMVENISLKPKLISAKAKAKILELYNRLKLSAKGSYAQKNYNEIKSKLKEIIGNEVDFFMQPISYNLYVEFEDENFLRERLKDVNAKLKETDLNYSISAYSLKINFNKDTNYVDLKNKINSALADFNVMYKFDEPKVFISADCNADINSLQKIEELFKEYDLNLNVKRYALLDLNINKLKDEKTNQEFGITKEQRAWIKPKHNTKEEIDVGIQAIAVRKKINYLEVYES